MSAIAGLWRFDDRPDADADCLRMLAAQEVYGPHDGRLWSEGPLAMGRRLFRSLPEDIHDRQPLHSRDGRLTLVADIRIDNRDELTGALALPAAETRQLCDAAILLACLERWGAQAIDRLAGDFAFALWDARTQSLILARDFLGQVPLHYHRGRNFFAFASMAKGLHALADIPRAVDQQAMAEYVALIPETASRSYFTGIERVNPAHVVTVTRHGVTSRRYWQPRRPGPARIGVDDAVEGLRHHLDQATRSMLRGANGRVGAHLSSGLDSSAVTATAARLLAPSGGQVVAFTAVPREGYAEAARSNRLLDEGPLAGATAGLYPNIEHVLVRSGHVSPLAGLDRCVYFCERPILNPSNWVWVHAINDAARERKLTILLTGQMGNMSLSFLGLKLLPELLRAGRLFRLWREVRQLVTKSEMGWRRAAALTLGPFMPRWLWHATCRGFGLHKRTVLNYSAIRAERLAEFDLDEISSARGFDFTYRDGWDGFAFRQAIMARFDPGGFNKGILGGWGLVQRDPTADKRLVEYCLSIPTEHFLTGGVPRALAKNALADRLPPAVLTERRKGYQAADWHEGFEAALPQTREELARLSACAPAAHLLDIERLQRMADEWPSSGWSHGTQRGSYRLAMLRGIAVGHFMRRTTGENR